MNYKIILFALTIFLIACNKRETSTLIEQPSVVNTKYAISLSPNNLAASIVVPSSTYNYINSNYFGLFSSSDSVKVVADMLYQKFNDNFDFIFVISNNSIHLTNQPYGVNFQVSNAVKGLGINIYNGRFGISSNKLKSFMFLPFKDAITNGPTLHEIAHNWANDIPKGFFKTLDVSSPSLPEMDALDGHWGIASTSGQLGGFDLSSLKTLTDSPNHYHAHIGSKLSFGLNANGGNSVPYSPIELYMMGMAPKLEVPDLVLFSGLRVNGDDFFKNGNFFATTKRAMSLDQLIVSSGIGERLPDYQSSQKQFRGLVLIVTPTALTTQDWSDYETMVTNFFKKSNNESSSFNFFKATNGRGWIKVDELKLELK